MYDDVTVEVASACSIGATNNEHTGNIESGNLTTIGNDSTFNITCNDADGYIVYVVGNTNDEEGNTDLIGTKNNNKITTGTNTSGDTSNWFFKLSNPSGLTINSGLSENSIIPSTRTNAVSRASGVSNPEGDTFTASYSAYISSLQPADTYTGKVKYLLFHPSSSDEEGNVPTPMQNFDCSTLNDGQSIKLTDMRDGNEYTVAKLKDGKCWMTDNLRLGDSKLTAKNPDRKLTSADTDITDDYTLPASSPEGFSNDSAANLYVPDAESGNYKMEYGGYYTWVAATAGTGASITTDYQNAPSSICPKGWRLPMGSDKSDNTNEFALLSMAYGGTGGTEFSNTTLLNKLITPSLPNFVFSGYYLNSSPSYQGSNGYWWSSTSCVSGDGYYLNLDSEGFVYPLISDSRLYGYSVRCIAR